MTPMTTRTWAGLGAAVMLAFLSSVCQADEQTELGRLRRKVDEQDAVIHQQQATIQQLLDRFTRLETKVTGRSTATTASSATPNRVALDTEELAALPPEVVQQDRTRLPLKLSGYVDIGYVDPAGDGTVSTSALQINSRGDNLSTVGLDGDSSFLVNELNLNLVATPAERTEAVANLAFLPRKLSITSSGGSAFTDTFEVNLAYLAYEPFEKESGPWIDNLFGDLKLYLGKFDSPIGIEYRSNKAPDRVNISRSMMSIYWAGYPVGIKARGKLFKDRLNEFRHSVLTYNLALANAEPWMTTLIDVDRATNSRRTIMGRLSYGLDLVPEMFFESGVSLAYGPRINQGDNNTLSDSIDLDSRLEWGPLTLRAEYDYSNLDRPRAGGSASTFSHIYLEGFYEIPRPAWLPKRVPLTSLTPYYRYDMRDLNTTPATGPSTTLLEVNRHTFALRYLLAPKRMLKAEYQVVEEAEGASVNDNAFLMSFIQEF